jgi:hypothetical protein
MAIYKLRVVFEENEDVYRDIEIKSGQTFEEFHEAIQEAYKFDKKHAASFFVSDDFWRKGQEITLRKEDLPLDEIDIRKKAEPKKLMAEVKIAKYIDQPHQRFVYVFDPVVQWSFLIELMKIDSDNPKVKYPVCVKTVGTAPKQYKQTIIKEEEEGGTDALLAAILGGGVKKKAKEEDDDVEESDIYKALNTEGIEAGDLESLEGEEGEEESADAEEDEFGDEDGDGDDFSFSDNTEEDH